MKRIVAALAAVALLGACGAQTEEAESVTVGMSYVPDVQFFPFYVADHEGFFDDAGVAVTLRHHGAQEPLFTALTTGEEDVLYAGGDEVMYARAEGIDVVNFATLYQEYPVTLIVPEDSDITSPADLEGRSVGLPGEYGANWFGLLAMLDEYELENVDIQSIGFTQMAALSRGDVDAVVGFINNDAVAMESQGFDVRTIDLAPNLPLIGPGLSARGDSFDEFTDAYAAILEGVEKAIDFAAENPEETIDIVTTYVPGMSDPEVRAAATLTFNATLPLYQGDGRIGVQDTARWEAMSEFMSGTGLISTDVPADEAMTTSVIDAR
ncbi:ABC transporter substrate-binding protein [Flaviflexus huanghaiensis]|uniref:ABC transporter substrate-binding protein n=1 Tax=Flaviflexus huanghaiensis TaxID=1111473 RepID=UPI0015FBC7F1|nr:ABC transporter substrate-binding protein [Flaviflexus huanghaiensis]